MVEHVNRRPARKATRSRSFQWGSTSSSPSTRRPRLQKAETISEDRLESARQAAGLNEKIEATPYDSPKITKSISTNIVVVKEETGSQQESTEGEAERGDKSNQSSQTNQPSIKVNATFDPGIFF